MKKILFFITLLTIANISLAQTECATIAEVRAQKNKTEIKYTGIATTTFYGPAGILIADETGYLYVKNSLLSEWGSSSIKPNMKITNICGLFNQTSDMDMSHILIEFNDDVKKIQIKEETATFAITDVKTEDLISNPKKYECQPIRLTEIDVIHTGWSYYIGNGNKTITLVGGYGVIIPARGTFEGYYGNNNAEGFVIPSAKHIKALAYHTIPALKEAYELNAPNSLEILEPMIVNYVKTNEDNSLDVYVQQTDQHETTAGLVLHIESYSGTINANDIITGIKGLYSAFRSNNDGTIKKGSTFTISKEEAQSIQIISKNNNENKTAIDDLEYIVGEGTRNYEALLSISPKGTITKLGEKYYLTNNRKNICLYGIDFSKYEKQSLAIIGIVDAGNINPGETTLIVRSESDLLATNYKFNSIAEMKQMGEPLATGITYTLDNNVLVTHTHSWKAGDLTVYAMFVQDETAGLYIESQSKLNVIAGDSIKGITGTYHGYITQKAGANLNIISHNNLDKIEFEEVTMADLKANPHKYENRVVKLMGVGHGSRKMTSYGETYTEKYLYQSKDTMIYNIWDYTLYQYNNIVGVFDFGSYQNFSIVPLSQDYIEQGVYIPTNVDNTIINNTYIHNNTIHANNATSIQLFNINGLLIEETNSDHLNISHLQSGVYIVVIKQDNNITTTKIIK